MCWRKMISIRLPAPVQHYIRYSGAMNKPKVKNMSIVFDGEMREKERISFKFHSEQYNFLTHLPDYSYEGEYVWDY